MRRRVSVLEGLEIKVYLFRLDQQTGQLSSAGRLWGGAYRIEVKVHDVWKNEVRSTVSVYVKEIGDDAIANSGSLWIRG